MTRKLPKLAHPSKPCNDCPFRREGGVRLSAERIRDITSAVAPEDGNGEPFTCHKTTPKRQRLHCAGALVLAFKLGRPSQIARTATSLGLVAPHVVEAQDPEIFDTVEEMLQTALDL